MNNETKRINELLESGTVTNLALPQGVPALLH